MLTIVVGGFFGDEGKGKIVSYLSLSDNVDIAIRCGSINAGHTVVYGGRIWRLRIIPSAFLNKNTKLMIPAGALIKIDLLFKELSETSTQGRVFIDRNTGVIEDKHVELEKNDKYLVSEIGSTLQGVGYATSDRVLRKLRLASEFNELKNMLIDVAYEVNNALDRGLKVIVEGVQGTFLSLYHGTYPYVTSRDTLASAFLSEVGIGPRRVDEVVIVFKSYVTRVGSGPLDNELSIEELRKLGWVETGSVTGRLRRAAPFNLDYAKRAVMLNSATQIAITRIDALFPETRGVREWSKLSINARKWIEEIESILKTPVSIISTGPDVYETVDRRRELGLLR